MPNFVSPGVYVIEKDISDYTPAINPSVVGVVGFADKGEPNKATLITSPTQLIDTFGRPNEDLPGQGIEGAMELLSGPNGTNQLWYVRAMDQSTTSTASTANAIVRLGSHPAIGIDQGNYGGPDGTPLYLKVRVTNQNGISMFPEDWREFEILPDTASTQALALRQVLGGGGVANHVGAHWDDDGTEPAGFGPNAGVIVGNYAGDGATLSVEAYANADMTAPLDALKALDADGNLAVAETAEATAGGVTFSNTMHYFVESLFEGAGYNQDLNPNGSVVGNAIGVALGDGSKSTLTVYQDGGALENFNVSLTPEAFVEGIINTGSTNPTSQVIKGRLRKGTDAGGEFDAVPMPFVHKINDIVAGGGHTVQDLGGNTVKPRFCGFLRGEGVPLADGDSGTGSVVASLVGNVQTQGGILALTPEAVPCTMAIVPGISDEFVQNSLIDAAETKQSFLAVLGTPLGVGTAQNVIDWHNGNSDIRANSLNSSYAAVYYPQVKVNNTLLQKDIWLDPGIYGIKQMCYTDNVSEEWFAPAGFTRGILGKPTELEVDLNQGDRDALYSGGNAINPIVKFPQRGIAIFGQRTTQRAPTALDRVNVRRLLLAVRRAILAATQQYAFEPNDEITWERVKNTLDPFLSSIQNRRGITQFKVVCDETTNTPLRVDRNELWCKVLIKPTKTAEVIVFELNITNQATNL